MKLLTLNFLMYTITGIWRPIDLLSNSAKFLYNVYTFLILFSLYFFLITLFLDIVFVVDSIDDYINNSFLFVSLIVVCCKATVMIARRSEIINLVQMLLKKPCNPQDENEIAIQAKFDEFIRLWTVRYSLLVTSSFTSFTIKSVLIVMHGQFPYRVWLPYNSTIPIMFWFTAIHQIITVIYGSIINIGTETLIFGLFLQTCAQLEIFEYRLYKFVTKQTNCVKQLSTSPSKKKVIISEHVRHHLIIYKYAKTTNVIFNEILFLQFFSSILVLCTNIFYISTHITEYETTIFFFMYTVSMFVQIYFYCWPGNEVMLKSKSVGDTIYYMDWPLLSTSERKDLLLIMIRSTRPIKFTSSFLITLSLQSYANILKTSYSAFNVLQQS